MRNYMLVFVYVTMVTVSVLHAKPIESMDDSNSSEESKEIHLPKGHTLDDGHDHSQHHHGHSHNHKHDHNHHHQHSDESKESSSEEISRNLSNDMMLEDEAVGQASTAAAAADLDVTAAASQLVPQVVAVVVDSTEQAPAVEDASGVSVDDAVPVAAVADERSATEPAIVVADETVPEPVENAKPSLSRAVNDETIDDGSVVVAVTESDPSSDESSSVPAVAASAADETAAVADAMVGDVVAEASSVTENYLSESSSTVVAATA